MAEAMTLTTPIEGQAAITVMRLAQLTLDNVGGRVIIQVREWTGTVFAADGRFREFVFDAFSVPTGATLIVALNKANLSAVSLEKRVMNQLHASGVLRGAISGSPD